jgi:hypothetical protein
MQAGEPFRQDLCNEGYTAACDGTTGRGATTRFLGTAGQAASIELWQEKPLRHGSPPEQTQCRRGKEKADAEGTQGALEW